MTTKGRRRSCNGWRPDPHLAAAILCALGEAECRGRHRVLRADGPPCRGGRAVSGHDSAAAAGECAGSAGIGDASAIPRCGVCRTLAVLTVHHCSNRARGLAELAQVTWRWLVIVTWDPAASGFWLIEDYFPEIGEIDRRILPSMDELRGVMGDIAVRPLLVPHDCLDGFLGAYWQRPSAYLDAGVRSAISTFSKTSDVESGLARLRRDLKDGT